MKEVERVCKDDPDMEGFAMHVLEDWISTGDPDTFVFLQDLAALEIGDYFAVLA